MRAEALLGAVMAVVAGVWMLFFHGHFSAWRRREHEARLTERLTRGSDAYFEELRDIRAYAPGRFPRSVQMLGGALLLIFGVSYLAFTITR